MDLTLAQLQAQFYRYNHADKVSTPVASLGEATTVWFLCPKCFIANKGDVGTHWVACHFEGKVSDDANPKPGRWNPTGSGIENLTFVPGKNTPSVQLNGGCNAHFHVTNGRIVGLT